MFLLILVSHDDSFEKRQSREQYHIRTSPSFSSQRSTSTRESTRRRGDSFQSELSSLSSRSASPSLHGSVASLRRGGTPLVDSCRGSSSHLQDRSQTPTPNSSVCASQQSMYSQQDEAYYSRTLPRYPAKKPNYLPLLPQQRSLDENKASRSLPPPPLPQPSYSQGYINFPRLNDSPTEEEPFGKKRGQAFFHSNHRRSSRGSYDDLTQRYENEDYARASNRYGNSQTFQKRHEQDAWDNNKLSRKVNTNNGWPPSKSQHVSSNLQNRSRSQPYLQQPTSDDDSDWC